MGLFLNPWNMILGGLLISSPIIIHLINRMRFKRVRWAAMEFLLKSQKRNRRRMIIEQLILLMLRILLILLIGLLLARYYNTITGSGQGTLHVVVLDDSLSMSDRNREDLDKVKPERKDKRKQGGFVTCYERGRDQIAELLATAIKANSPQEIQVVLLSQPDEVIFSGTLNTETMSDIDKAVDLKRPVPTGQHLSPLNGIKAGGAILQRDKSARAKVLHLVSDFREVDWVLGSEADDLTKAVLALTKGGVNVSFLDAAADPRKSFRGEAKWHENVAIVDLQAASRGVTENQQIEFKVTLENNSEVMKSPHMVVRIDGGIPDDFGTRQLQGISPHQRHEEKFQMGLKREPNSNRPQFRRVSVEIDPEENGLSADHIREVVVQVYEKLPVLVVIPSNEDPARMNEGFYLATALSSDRLFVKYEVSIHRADELPTLDLDKYASVYLLNIDKFDPAVVKKLQEYTAGGGSLAFFLGNHIDARFYNEVLHRNEDSIKAAEVKVQKTQDGSPEHTEAVHELAAARNAVGLFPVAIRTAPEESPSKKDIMDRKQNDPQAKFQFPEPDHPAIKKIADGTQFPPSFFATVSMNVYFRALPPREWVSDAEKETRTLIRMPPHRTMDDYRQKTSDLMDRVVEVTKEVKDDDPFKVHAAQANIRAVQIRTSLNERYPYKLGLLLDALLHEKPSEKEGSNVPDLTKFWASTPAARKLAAELEAFQHEVMQGDPLLVSRTYGKGKVVAWLSSASTRPVATTHGELPWHDYGDFRDPAAPTFLPFVWGLESYLQNNASEESTRLIGSKPAAFLRDPERYKDKVLSRFYPQADMSRLLDKDNKQGREVKEEVTTTAMERKKVVIDEQGHEKEMLIWTPKDFSRAGIYLFEFTPTTADLPPDIRTLAINVDALLESNLKRASLNRLEIHTDGPGTIRLIEAGDSFEAFKKRDPDLSESPWLYLFFLLVLVAEQAMAVHLSFHMKGEGAALPASPAPTPAA